MNSIIKLTADYCPSSAVIDHVISVYKYDILSLVFKEFAVQVEAEKTEMTAEKEQMIVKDLNTMSQKEKLKLLKKESPELLELIQDFKAKVLL